MGELSDAERAFHEKLAVKGRGFYSDVPEVPMAGEDAYEAFWALTSSRSVGMGVGGIPFLAVDRYADRYQIDDFETFHHLLREMDGAYLKHTNAKGDR